jgi:hypothetical protein
MLKETLKKNFVVVVVVIIMIIIEKCWLKYSIYVSLLNAWLRRPMGKEA